MHANLISNKSYNTNEFNCRLVLVLITCILIVGGTMFGIIYSSEKNKDDDDEGDNDDIKVTCSPGYYLPNDVEQIRSNCKQCSIENCYKCEGSSLEDNCTSCGDNFFPNYNDDQIQSCDIKCKTGGDDQCGECDTETNKCIGCNACFLLKNEECIPNYSMKAYYYAKGYYSKIQIIDITFLDYIVEMSIDDKKVNPASYFTVYDENFHKVYILFDLTGVKSLNRMFDRSDLYSINFTSLFNTENIESMDYMFFSSTKLKSADFSNFNTENTKSFYKMFYSTSLESFDFSYFNMRKAENISGMFDSCSELTFIDFSKTISENLKDISLLFNKCSSLQYVDLANIRAENLVNSSFMFNKCTSLNSIIFPETFNKTSLLDINSMFSSCSKLKELSLANFDSSKVTNMSSLFFNCLNLRSIDLSNFITSNVINMNHMFDYCIVLTSINLGSFDTSKVTDMKNMFYYYFINILRFINV